MNSGAGPELRHPRRCTTSGDAIRSRCHAARDARPSTAPPPLPRRQKKKRERWWREWRDCARASRSAARAAVAHPARLPEPNGLPRCSRRPSAAPSPLLRRHGCGEGGGGESGATAEPRSAARAAVAHPARLPEPNRLPHTRPTHTAEPPTRVGPIEHPTNRLKHFQILPKSGVARSLPSNGTQSHPRNPSYPHSSTPHTRGARRFGAGLGHTPEREKRERAREKRRERENDGG